MRERESLKESGIRGWGGCLWEMQTALARISKKKKLQILQELVWMTTDP